MAEFKGFYDGDVNVNLLGINMRRVQNKYSFPLDYNNEWVGTKTHKWGELEIPVEYKISVGDKLRLNASPFDITLTLRILNLAMNFNITSELIRDMHYTHSEYSIAQEAEKEIILHLKRKLGMEILDSMNPNDYDHIIYESLGKKFNTSPSEIRHLLHISIMPNGGIYYAPK